MGQKLFFGKGTISLTKETSYKIYVVSVEIVRVGLGQVLKCPTSEYSASCAFVRRNKKKKEEYGGRMFFVP